MGSGFGHFCVSGANRQFGSKKEVRWLWYPYIPSGKVTLLQGDPGGGKSKRMLSLAALLSKGAPLPFADEDERCEPMTVIYPAE